MIETDNSHESTGGPDPTDVADLQRRVVELEQALMEYVERYGLSDKARKAFRVPKP